MMSVPIYRLHETLDTIVDSGEMLDCLGRIFACGRNGKAVAGLVRALKARGSQGEIAAALLGCQKASKTAKESGKSPVYESKAAYLNTITDLLTRHPHEMRWGWATDDAQFRAKHVIYVDLPTGQVSFHALKRGDGPDYISAWDGECNSEIRILQFCSSVLLGPA